MDIEDSGHHYSRSEKYIIFRDIDLVGVNWTPLMFSGKMEGRLNMQSGVNPTISNIDVVQNGDLDMQKIWESVFSEPLPVREQIM